MAKKKERELNPTAVESKGNLTTDMLQEMAQDMKGLIDIKSPTNNGENFDSYFKAVVEKLMDGDEKNISLRTEYLGVNENFAGTKLEFMAKYYDMPYLKDFVNIFEKKRVSLERKGRKEIIMALEKREEEIRMRQMNMLNNMQRQY